jgi:3-phenylpropionate/trans-cinnamate dioxygenase ferredoxin subunit
LVFTVVAKDEELPEGGTLRRMVGELPVALFRVAGEVYCLDDTCTHAFASLSQGKVNGRVITCPLHGGQFDIPTGRPVHLPVVEAAQVHPVRVEAGEILVGYEPDEDEDYD